MQDEHKPPSSAADEPVTTGIQGEQSPLQASPVTIVPAGDWKAQESLSDTLRGIQEGRRVAASAIFGITSAGVRMLEDELTAARSDRQSADLRERESLQRYYAARESAAVSNARLESVATTTKLRSVMQNLASVLIGAAIAIYVAPCPPGAAPNVGVLQPAYIAGAFALIGIVLYVATLLCRPSYNAIKGGSNVV